MPLPDMPLGHPMTSKDPKWRIWQAWRASVMAGWIEGDIQTIRNSVGEQALVAVDVLDVNDSDYRLAADSDRSLAGGPSRIFRTINPNIYKVNWTWLLGTCESWDRGYNLCVPIAAANNRAISEHMTLNNADFSPEDVDPILKNTLAKGNRFGWWLCAWANVGNNVGYLYNNDWSPKPVIKVLDDHRDDYLRLARASLTKPLPDLPAPAQTQLAPNHSMGIGWTCSLVSKNGDFSANMQHDGNLVISTSGLHPVWATGTNGHAGAFATMQPTGELVVLSADGKTLWTTGTAGHPGAHASVLDSGKLVIVSPTGEVLWTGGK